MRCLETSRRLSQFEGEEIYDVVPFLFINYRIYMALDETMKPFLFTFDAANIEITCDQASQFSKKMGKSKDRLISG